MRGTSGHEEVDRKQAVRAVENFRMIAKRTSRNCTGAYRDHDFRIGHCLVGLFKSQSHVLSYGAGDQKSVRVSG